MKVLPKYPYTNVISQSERLILLANLIHDRLGNIGFGPFLKYLIDVTPYELLDALAEEFSLTVYEGWAIAATPEKKRLMIKDSISLHRSKGTAYSIKNILEVLGFGKTQVITGLNRLFLDGKGSCDGVYFYGDDDLWAFYRVVFLDRPISNSQAVTIRKVLESFAPAHMVLLSLNYAEATLTYNGFALCDGEFNAGELAGS